MFALLLAVAVADPPRPTPNTLALAPGATPATATLADVGWLAGQYVGDGLGGTCEEVWLPPLAGSGELLGVFRFVAGGKTRFTEQFVLAQDGPSLTIRLKHFHADLTGWEEKDKVVTFKLVRLADGEANFDKLTYRKTADGLDAFVVLTRNGKAEEAAFRLKRR